MQHLYFATDNLNAPYDQSFVSGLDGLGAGSLAGNALAMRGLGASACEDRAKATATTDCKSITGDPTSLAACIAERTAEYIRRDCAGGGGAPPPSDLPKTPTELPKTRARISSDTWWLIGGVVVAAGAVGAALYVRARKKRAA
jgi:hypothetical protein